MLPCGSSVAQFARVPEPQSIPLPDTWPRAGRSTVSVRRTRAKSAPASLFSSIFSAHSSDVPAQSPPQDSSSLLAFASALSRTVVPCS